MLHTCAWWRACMLLTLGGNHAACPPLVDIFGLFSTKGEKPPWYLNPLITFPSIFVIVGVGFWAVVALGGLHRGEVPVSGDDLSAFIGEVHALPALRGRTPTYPPRSPSRSPQVLS